MAARALLPQEERLVSACMLARTNYFGVPVLLSMRRKDAALNSALYADAAERARFTRLEGKFYGNLFAPGQPAFFCKGDERPDREAWLKSLQRVCAIGDADPGMSRCGFLDTGPCRPDSLRQAGVNYEEAAIDVFLPTAPGR